MIQYQYIENISFFISPNINIPKEWPQQNSCIFQNNNDLKYIFKIEDKKLYRKLIIILAKNLSDSIRINKIYLTLSRFGICNLRIFCLSKNEINPDEFSFDDKLPDVYKALVEFFEQQGIFPKENDIKKLFEIVDSDGRYLYHQHIEDNKIQSPINVKWSVYRYKYIDNEHSNLLLDLDSLLLERHVLYYVFSRCYIELLKNEEISQLKPIRKLLNTNRKTLAEQELLLQELDSENFEKFDEYSHTHRLKKTEELYRQLENNIEHLSEQLEDERRYKKSMFMERIFLFLSFIGVISIITGFLSLLPDREKVPCKINTDTISYFQKLYSLAIDTPGFIVILISSIVVSILFLMFIGGIFTSPKK